MSSPEISTVDKLSPRHVNFTGFLLRPVSFKQNETYIN